MGVGKRPAGCKAQGIRSRFTGNLARQTGPARLLRPRLGGRNLRQFSRHLVGGAAVTEEFHPGFSNSVASYTVSLLNPKVIRDLRLHEHGLRVVERPYANFLPLPDGRSFRLGGEHTLGEVAKWSARDAQRLPDYWAMLDRIVVVLRELMQRTPPNVSDRFVLADWLNSASAAKQLKSLDMRGRRDLLDQRTPRRALAALRPSSRRNRAARCAGAPRAAATVRAPASRRGTRAWH
mgnify:CR=1 FL=1